MTGPDEGKFLLKNCKVYLRNEQKKEISAEIYIHLKGYSLARVTHLDIEHNSLNRLIKPESGYFFSIHGTARGLEVKLKDKSLHIHHPYLTEVLAEGEKTRTWVGGKVGGIYIGFRKPQIVVLEKIVREKFGFRI